MSSAVLTELPAPSEPARGRIYGALNHTRHHLRIAGVTPLAAAGVILAIRGTGSGFPDPTRFALLETGLIAAGSVGCPSLAMRALGRYATPQVCALIAAVLASAAVLLATLVLAGQMHPKPQTATFAVILLVSGALQSMHARAFEMRTARRAAAAYQAARTDAAAEQLEARYRAVANLERLDAMDVGELGMLIEVASGLRNKKLCEHGALRLVPAPTSANGHRHNGVRTDRA